MKVLVVVDMQDDFITGTLGTKEAQDIIPNVKRKVEEAVKNGDLIIYTRDTHFTNYLDTEEGRKLPVKHCICGTPGWWIPDKLLPNAGYDNVHIVDKYTFGLYELPTRIHQFLKNGEYEFDCDSIELVGLCTDICVVSNALLLKSYFFNEFEISVDASCCAGTTPENHEAALRVMESCQIDVKRDCV